MFDLHFVSESSLGEVSGQWGGKDNEYYENEGRLGSFKVH